MSGTTIEEFAPGAMQGFDASAPPQAGGVVERKEPEANLPVAGASDTDFGDLAGAGMENVSHDERLTPALRMLQGLSPQLDPSKPEYLPEARLSNILNSASLELYDGQRGLDLIVFGKDYHYGEWLPRDSGGGFRGMHAPSEPLVLDLLRAQGRFKALEWTNPAGEAVQLVQTGQLFVLYAPADEMTAETAKPAFLAFTSTAFPVYQTWLHRHENWTFRQPNGRMASAPIFWYRWRLSTVPQQNKKGSFFNWKLDLAPPARGPLEATVAKFDPAMFAEARRWFDSYNTGSVKADQAERQPGEDDAEPF